ncbi:ATP-binding protein [Streptoalloteichus hindustanus]|uniref:Uncharacterized protein n=1 Tax=Streptoalloteichus hindustanus TaxID=2017 RepID=A0A1M5ICS2_STRHI|nr:hypothetical protein [Streptoalloteichus hindustanus]SHG26061.1 hypothetical protein SAMN05444320_107226 [Streptoalloteichus hindustanus]
MSEFVPQLRRWFETLDDRNLTVVLQANEALRLAANLPAGTRKRSRPALKRELRAVRVWAARASTAELAHMATTVLQTARHHLKCHLGFDPEIVDAPTAEQMGDMLVALGRPIGQLVLFGLVLGDVPVSPLARAHQAELEDRLARAPDGMGVERRWHEHADDAGKHDVVSEEGRLDGPSQGDEHVGGEQTPLAALEADLAVLREDARALASEVRAMAERVAEGHVPDEHTIRRLTEYREAHVAFVARCANQLDGLEGEASLDVLAAKIGQARELRERERRQRTQRVDELRLKIPQMRQMIAGEQDAATRDLLTQALARYVDEWKEHVDDEPPPGDEEPAAPPETERSSTDSGDDERHESPPDHDIAVISEHEEDIPVSSTVSEEMAAPVVRAGNFDDVIATPPVEPVVRADDSPGAEPPEDLTVAFPWEEGDPPAAAQLVREGRFAEAYWVTAASGEPSRRTEALRLAAVAYHAQNGADASAVQTALKLDAQSLEADHDATVLAVTAVLRAGLVAGWGHPILGQLWPGPTLPPAWEALLEAAVGAVRRGYRVDPSAAGPGRGSNVDDVTSELRSRALRLAVELPKRTTSYQRGTRVLQHLSWEDQPLGHALRVVAGWAAGTVSHQELAAVARELGESGAVDDLIERADEATRTPKQAKVPIVAGARRALRRSIEEVVALVAEAEVVGRGLAATEPGADAAGAALVRVAVELEGAPEPSGMAGAALALFRRWLLGPGRIAAPSPAEGRSPEAPDLMSPTEDVLLILPDLPRAADGRPDLSDPRTPGVLARLLDPADEPAALTAYCDRGDLRSARRLLDVVQAQGADSGESDLLDRMRETLAGAHERWERRHRRALTAAHELLARVRTQNRLPDAEAVVAIGRLESLATVPDGAYDVAARELDELTADLRARQENYATRLREELGRLSTERKNRDRIGALLDAGDTVTADEFLAFLREGTELPEADPVVGEDLAGFVAVLRKGAERAASHPDTARAWADFTVRERKLTALTQLAEAGVSAWDALADSCARAPHRTSALVRTVLGLLGMEDCHVRESTRNRRGVRQFRSTVDRISEQSYVAALGSAARGEYTVFLVTDELRGRGVLDVLGDVGHGGATLVLYLHAMDLAARRSLATESRSGHAQALVVDPAVIGWVAANAPGSWRATQRVTLPWTGLNPYTPFVAGLVPPEVFVGRAREIEQVAGEHGGLFVYGGRQLGKSTLLRRVQANFDNGVTQHAVYLDLKAAGIGDQDPASVIWRVLTAELKSRGVLGPRTPDEADAALVVTQVRAWLTANPARRVLLLADEADAFLNADSGAVPGPGGVSHFPNVLRLKELMESTGRRFKVVFAGLHQVQRFGHLSNVPLAHGGPDILVGPLRPADAQQLVVRPMAALGYRFERPELVWRLLAATNYQPGLIQIFCNELVTALHRRSHGPAGPPVVVTEADVEAIAASDRVRARIAERLRFTINLEDRYRVLTLVIVLRGLADAFREAYAPEELLEAAREAWPAGFEQLTVSQVRIYLEEMVGLGLLTLTSQSRYAVRGPNVVNMLGTRADLERELAETDFDLPYEYNPRFARRLLDQQGGRERRSPLTEGELAQLLAVGEKNAGVSVVAATHALGIDRVSQAVRVYAKLREIEVRTATATDVEKAVASARKSEGPAVVVADLRGVADSDVAQVVTRLSTPVAELRLRAAVVLVDPDSASSVAGYAGTEPVLPTRWSEDSIRGWPECPFNTPAQRRELIEATGGWPDLVENVIQQVISRGATMPQALAAIRRIADQPALAADHLDKVGLGPELRRRLDGWVDYFEPGEVVPPADVAAALEVERPQVKELIDALDVRGLLDQREDGLALDRVVHRCLRTLRQAE